MLRTVLLISVASFALVAFWTLAPRAQLVDSDRCRSACEDRHSGCVTECGGHEEPLECEEVCRDELEDCLRECR